MIRESSTRLWTRYRSDLALTMLSERTLSVASTGIIGVFIARELGPVDFGIFATLTAAAAIAADISYSGFGGVLVREIGRDHSAAERIVRKAIELRLIVAAVTTLVMIPTAALVLPQASAFHIAAVALIPLGRSLEPAEQAFVAESRGGWIVGSRAISTAIALPMLTALIASGRLSVGSAIAVEVARIAGYSVALYVALYIRSSAHRALDGSPDTGPTRTGLARTVAPLMVGALASVIGLRIDQIMVAALDSPSAAGSYAVAVRLSEALYFLPVVLANASMPSLLHSRRIGRDAFDSDMIRLLRRNLLVAGAAVVVIVPSAAMLIGFAFGDEYTSSVPVLRIHILAFVFVAIRAALSRWLIVEHRLSSVALSQLVGALANVGLNFALIPVLGPAGAALTTLVSYCIADVLFFYAVPSLRPASRLLTLAALRRAGRRNTDADAE